MVRALILRLDAPLMSFGDIQIDRNGPTLPFPTLSQLTGLLGNALGYLHGDVQLLTSLQERLRYAVRADVAGVPVTDFQTADLGQPFMAGGWTTSGRAEGRAGGSAATGTVIRLRHYVADAVYTIALRVDPADASPTVEELAAALDRPARPLFIGRKPCLPSEPIAQGVVDSTSLMAVLADTPRAERRLRQRVRPVESAARVWWSADELEVIPDGLIVGHRLPLADRRDWGNQVHTGYRWWSEGLLRETPSAPQLGGVELSRADDNGGPPDG